MKKLFILATLGVLMGCSSLTGNNVNLEEKYQITNESLKNWEETYSTVVKGESQLTDWYGSEEPLNFLAKNGMITEKQVKFLDGLKTKPELTQEDKEEYISILDGIVDDLPREYFLKDENIKNAKGLVEEMVFQSYLKMQNPSKYISTEVATPEEWETIVAFSKQGDLSTKDVKKLRKLLNKFIKRGEFFNSESWYNKEVSDRVIEINNIYKKQGISGLEKNNVNAKALYIAYQEYLSELEKWDD